MGSSRSRNARIALLITFALLTYTFFILYSNRDSIPPRWTQAGEWTQQKLGTTASKEPRDADFGRVGNRTLGFEKVYAVGLNERTDKRDAMALMSAMTGFDIEWFNGVKPAEIPDKAVPFGIDVKGIKDNFLGSWRGHMNVIRHIVENDISSALIMEDDLDWDIHLKSQLQAVARGTRHLHATPISPRPNSPYGDVWDVLWLGHCGEPFPENLEENLGLEPVARAKMMNKYLIKNDETVPPYEQVSKLVDWSQYPERTRIVHMSAAPICSFAYAVSQSGARKLLHGMSVDGLTMAFDNSLAQMCRDAMFDLGRGREGGYDTRCISVNPTVMFHHKAKGRLSGDSDIQAYGSDGAVREIGMTESIQWSMRLNLKNLLTGRDIEPQF